MSHRLFAALGAILASMLLLAACKTEQPAAPTPTPVPTSTPEQTRADCFPAPRELGNPGPMAEENIEGVKVLTAQQVSEEDRNRVLEGLKAAQGYIATQFGPVKGNLCLEIRADDSRAGSGYTVRNRIIIFTERGGWDRPYPWLLSRATAHEYVHIWMYEVASNFERSASNDPGPGWLIEGIAEHLSMRMILTAGLAPVDEAETFTNTLLRLSIRTDLKELETLPLPNPEDYAVAELGVNRLLAGKDIAAVRQFYGAVGRGTPWRTAFSQSFALTPEAFYTQFAEWRRGLP